MNIFIQALTSISSIFSLSTAAPAIQTPISLYNTGEISKPIYFPTHRTILEYDPVSNIESRIFCRWEDEGWPSFIFGGTNYC